jgi:hypothetical protein
MKNAGRSSREQSPVFYGSTRRGTSSIGRIAPCSGSPKETTLWCGIAAGTSGLQPCQGKGGRVRAERGSANDRHVAFRDDGSERHRIGPAYAVEQRRHGVRRGQRPNDPLPRRRHVAVLAFGCATRASEPVGGGAQCAASRWVHALFETVGQIRRLPVSTSYWLAPPGLMT